MSKARGRIKQRDKENSTTVGPSVHHKSHNVDESPPVFSLRYLQEGYCLGCCQGYGKTVFTDRLFRLSQMLWDEIRKSDKHGPGTEKIARDTVKAPIPRHVTQDVDFIAFRSYSKAPMVGYKIGATFYALWLDREFKLYKH